jgi:hypothetical protein
LMFVFLCLYILLKPGWSDLLFERPYTRRILGVGLGCVLCLEIFPAILGAQGFSFFAIVQYFVIGMLLASLSLLNESRYYGDKPWFQVFATLLWIGPIVWIFLVGIGVLSQPDSVTFLALGGIFYQAIFRFGWINLLISILYFSWKIGSSTQFRRLIDSMFSKWRIPTKYYNAILAGWVLVITATLFSVSIGILSGLNILTYAQNVSNDLQAIGYASGLLCGLAITDGLSWRIRKARVSRSLQAL